MKRAVALAVLIAANALAQNVDPVWLRYWQEAQKGRPANIGWQARIAAPREPGTPLVVHGRVVAPEGRPVPDVIVFAYQTDATGVYNRRGEPGYRLRGWARTDRQGRFEFHTIRPAAYPTGTEPPHIHFTIEGPRLPRRWTRDLEFTRGTTVSTRNGVQHVDFTIRVADEGRF